ncbi:MAG: hypothetical protein JWP55_3970 [Mycobacterium sp.]|jgi:hypothetical protein|nr:hypothetical protein [Mycobacterium sp.]
MRNQDHLLKINSRDKSIFSSVGIRAVGVPVGFARVRIWFGDVPAGAVGAVALLARHRSVPVRVH